MNPVRIAVIGAGEFGRHHMRVLKSMPGVELTSVYDIDPSRSHTAAGEYGAAVAPDLQSLAGAVDAAVIAVPTNAHADTGCELLAAGIDVLVEKPIAPDLQSADRLIDAARRNGRILQVGHLERFNPGVEAVAARVTTPLFFEIHRLSLFTPRSLDVDVVLDLMIHDIDVLLSMTGTMPEEVRAAGIRILSQRVDIANVRLAFPGGCVANLTASRVSTERVRKLRLFQPHQYISLDFQKQEAVAFSVSPQQQIGFEPYPIQKAEPLQRELESFVNCVTGRQRPRVDGEEARKALEVCLEILLKIEEHAQVIQASLAKAQ